MKSRNNKLLGLILKRKKWLCKTLIILFLALNVLAYLGVYALTHFTQPGIFGIGLPRPNNTIFPSDIKLEYVTKRIAIHEREWLESWFIPAQKSPSKGTVLLFPGHLGNKAKQLLAPTQVFHALGYDTLLVDFRGVGGSSGNATTLGFREAQDVVASTNYARQSNFQSPIFLYGVSMGTAAIMKAVAQGNIRPDAIILELPFARMLDAVRSRFREIGIPPFPIAELAVFWGGIQHGFNAFSHNPVSYAEKIDSPTLILHGKRDRWTSLAEIDRIQQSLRGTKQVVIFSNAGHDLLVTVDKSLWRKSVEQFLGLI
jgi:uncharacterized protein